MIDLGDDSRSRTSSDRPVKNGESPQPGEGSAQRIHGRRHSGREHGERKSRPRRLRVFWDFKYELLALVFIGGGIFLLVAPFKISTWLFGLARQALAYLNDIAVWLIKSVGAIEKSDVGGVVLLVCAVGLIGLDIRTRILRRHERYDSEPLCSCGSQMRRLRTTLFQQILAWVFRVRIKRFFCPKCSRQLALWRTAHESDW